MQVSTATAIQNPFTFYYIGNNDWSTSHNYQFWNKNFSTNSNPGVTNATTLKTIYDPSVSGFCLPKTAAFTGFTKTGATTTNISELNVNGSYTRSWNYYTNGWKSGNTIFFESFGYLQTNGNNSAGELTNTATSAGIYWTTAAYSSLYAHTFKFNYGYTQVTGQDSRSCGFSVRSVLE